MNCERTLIASVVMLVLGLGLIFTYCHGTIGFNAAYPASGASLQVAINTTGLAAMTGVGSTIIGLFAADRGLDSGSREPDPLAG